MKARWVEQGRDSSGAQWLSLLNPFLQDDEGGEDDKEEGGDDAEGKEEEGGDEEEEEEDEPEDVSAQCFKRWIQCQSHWTIFLRLFSM
jgi:hypothetical protein